MSKILILAKSGFGKTTSIGHVPEAGIIGLKPEETYMLSCIQKPLPFKNSKQMYKETDIANMANGNRIISNNVEIIVTALKNLIQSPYKNIVLDDLNYLAQDYYMKNALRGGWDVPKQIGYNTGLIFDAINMFPDNKNIICMAHYEEYKDKNGDSISFKYKTTGNMVDAYICPEGKFEIVLYGKSTFDETTSKSIRQYVTNYDGIYPAKSPIGMFESLYIPNDLNEVITAVEKYY